MESLIEYWTCFGGAVAGAAAIVLGCDWLERIRKADRDYDREQRAVDAERERAAASLDDPRREP